MKALIGKILNGTLARFKEPSSWAGVATAVVAWVPFLQGAEQMIAALAAGLFGLIAFVMREKLPWQDNNSKPQ